MQLKIYVNYYLEMQFKEIKMREEEFRLYWMQCLQMALAKNPESPKKQKEIADILFKSIISIPKKESETALESALHKIKN